MTNQDEIIIKKQQDIHKHYWCLSQFLAQFAVDADFDIFDPEGTIKRSYEPCERDYKEYQVILSQANEILAMEPFPIDALSYASGGLNTTPEWLRNVLHLLELRVVGKL